MNTSSRIGIVAGGYAAAFVVAAAAIALLSLLTPVADRSASSGMSAFGDGLLFVVVFGLAAIVPTGFGLYFLRPVAGFWRGLAVVALLVASTSVIAAAVFAALRGAPGSFVAEWSGLAVLRLFAAPFAGGAWFVATLFAPSRNARLALLGAVGLEAASFLAMVVSLWFLR